MPEAQTCTAQPDPMQDCPGCGQPGLAHYGPDRNGFLKAQPVEVTSSEDDVAADQDDELEDQDDELEDQDDELEDQDDADAGDPDDDPGHDVQGV